LLYLQCNRIDFVIRSKMLNTGAVFVLVMAFEADGIIAVTPCLATGAYKVGIGALTFSTFGTTIFRHAHKTMLRRSYSATFRRGHMTCVLESERFLQGNVFSRGNAFQFSKRPDAEPASFVDGVVQIGQITELSNSV
jgi:hypothetical protein